MVSLMRTWELDSFEQGVRTFFTPPLGGGGGTEVDEGGGILPLHVTS